MKNKKEYYIRLDRIFNTQHRNTIYVYTEIVLIWEVIGKGALSLLLNFISSLVISFLFTVYNVLESDTQMESFLVHNIFNLLNDFVHQTVVA